MKEIEFNLLDEPWIRVRDDSCQVHEVSLTDALLHAHQYTSLSGELPTQDIVILRLMLAVLHTVFSGSLRNVGVVKSICKQVQMAAYQCSNHGISATGGFISHGYSFFRNRVSFVN